MMQSLNSKVSEHFFLIRRAASYAVHCWTVSRRCRWPVGPFAWVRDRFAVKTLVWLFRPSPSVMCEIRIPRELGQRHANRDYLYVEDVMKSSVNVVMCQEWHLQVDYCQFRVLKECWTWHTRQWPECCNNILFLNMYQSFHWVVQNCQVQYNR